jgi:hypothetical protein
MIQVHMVVCENSWIIELHSATIKVNRIGLYLTASIASPLKRQVIYSYYRNNRCLDWESYKDHKSTVWGKIHDFVLKALVPIITTATLKQGWSTRGPPGFYLRLAFVLIIPYAPREEWRTVCGNLVIFAYVVKFWRKCLVANVVV